MRQSTETNGRTRWRQVLLPFLLSLFRGALPDQIRYSIPEELPQNSIVGNLAKDLGLSVPDVSARKLRISAEKEYFVVKPESGDLLVSNKIDREEICGKKPLCVLDFDTVAENPLNIFHVTVIVEDINDNTPLFKQSKIDLKIGESTKPGKTFPLDPALDSDAGPNSLQRYYLNDNDYFELTEKQTPDGGKYPELILKHSLDREEQNFHQLLLTAVDGGDPPQSGTTQIQIQVTDANDNPPVFSQDVYRVSLQEGVPPGFLVLRVTATDQDEGVNAEITYSFHNVDEQVKQFFNLNQRTGEITSNDYFDFEIADSYTLRIEAKDPGDLAAHCSVQVEILDENDCAPEVIVTSVFTPLPEDSSPGTVIALVKTKDRDSGENGEVYCQILGKAEFILKSYLKNYYKLTTDRTLDREEISEYNITVMATDRGKPPLSSSITISLHIADVNDNTPVFHQASYVVHVPENNPPGASIAHVTASDPDLGPNGQVAYSIVASDLEPRALSSYVSVNPQSGVVFAQRAFDHEQRRAFELTLQARDHGSPALSSNVSLRVLVGDRNDNAPRVLYPALGPDGSALFDTVPRAAQPGYLVTKVVAVDADSGHNAWLSYHVLQASEPGLFSVGLRTGEVRTARALGDRDAARQRLLVAVRDGGQPPLSATATLLLVFADSLQEALPDLSERPAPSDPQVELQFYLVVALALISVLFLLAVILAVALHLRRSSSPTARSCFKPGLCVRSSPGVLPNYSEGTLPYSYNLCVASQSAKTEFNFLNITPEVVPPQDLLCKDASWVPSTNHGDAGVPFTSDTILKEVTVKVNENAAVGTPLVLPFARDADVGVNSLQRYQLSSNIHFSLDEKSGRDGQKYPELILEQPLDREKVAVHDLLLTALDGGDPILSGSTHIQVMVLDANDNAPLFTQSEYRVSVPENIAVGTRLLAVTATDPDEGINGKLTYSFRNEEDKISETFQLDSNLGEISTVQPLDYEESRFYDMEVVAQDGGALLTSAKVLITVQDVNDNAPEVLLTSLSSTVSEDCLPGTIIALVSVHDGDSGENGEVVCSIPRNLPFKLEKSVDNYYHLLTTRVLDREEISDYNITVTVTDCGNPPLSTENHIFLKVADINDNPPIFPHTSYYTYIPENNPRGISIFSVSAHDPDSGNNAQVTYALAEDKFQGTPLSSYVSINSDTGALYALGSFDYEQVKELQLWVTASDNGDPPLSSNVSLSLFILDQNDNAPEILYPAFPIDGSTGVELAPRSAEPGYLVTKVVAVDRDSGQNAWLSYRLLKASEPGLFTVGLHTGEVRTARALLDRDALKQSLVVAVQDHGQPPLSATVTLTVAVADSIPDMLADLGSLEPSTDPDDSGLTLYLVVAVASVSCIFLAFVIALLTLRLRRWYTLRALQASGNGLAGLPASHFVGVDGVRAFLQTYSHEVSLTADSRGSHVIFPQPNYADTLISQESCEKSEPLLIPEKINAKERELEVLQILFYLVLNFTKAHRKDVIMATV
ncbi:protocadherin gamma-B2-like isoform X2 [Moschus berezovskii]|uniref:protocadherin gamma-B2-like isoform X2 n=1 Tax=Moschus berezovskii TaxID=68408 RepID=UPI002443AF21|nr:protocadherin gamma-B2-like isoform X2 [Moschus berezovskii]